MAEVGLVVLHQVPDLSYAGYQKKLLNGGRSVAIGVAIAVQLPLGLEIVINQWSKRLFKKYRILHFIDVFKSGKLLHDFSNLRLFLT